MTRNLESEPDENALYTRSNGSTVLVKDMAVPHLKSAHAKLSRDWPGHSELPGMAAWIAKRDAEFAAQTQAQDAPI